MRVSVVMTVFNAEAYVAKAVESVLVKAGHPTNSLL